MIPKQKSQYNLQSYLDFQLMNSYRLLSPGEYRVKNIANIDSLMSKA